jgi:hypothetical protein
MTLYSFDLSNESMWMEFENIDKDEALFITKENIGRSFLDMSFVVVQG